jgi:hypothetical protein
MVRIPGERSHPLRPFLVTVNVTFTHFRTTPTSSTPTGLGRDHADQLDGQADGLGRDPCRRARHRRLGRDRADGSTAEYRENNGRARE